MLKSKQVHSMIAARGKIVKVAVSILGHALNSLPENGIVVLMTKERA
jgi:hypothetical protein